VLICGLVDGETVVAVVMVVTTETNDVVVDAEEVVERLDAVVVAEQTDVFFLAFSDYIKRPYISTDSRRDKADTCGYNSHQSPDQVLFRNPGSHQRSGQKLNLHEDQRNGSPLWVHPTLLLLPVLFVRPEIKVETATRGDPFSEQQTSGKFV
jgi:hypothetical protein